MTCIVGLETEDGVCIGGDSAGVSGWSINIRADEKVFKNGEYIFGFCGSFRMGQLLRYSFEPPTYSEGDIMRFMCTLFIDALRKCLKTGGYAHLKDSVESGGTFLVGHKNQLFYIGSDYQVGRSSDGYDAVGCGADVAIGALHILNDMSMQPRHKVVAALEAVTAHNGAVVAPFVVLDNCPEEIANAK